MISMEPVIVHGLTVWDRALLPPDEFSERLVGLRAHLAEAGLAAAIFFSDAYHPSADLAYFAGWPMGGALLVRREGEPTMLTSDNGRGAYFQRWLTWIDDVAPAGGRIGPALRERLMQSGITAGAIGVAGAQNMTEQAYGQARAALGAYDWRAIDAAATALRRVKRPREILALRKALAIAERGADAARRAFEAGASNANALLAAERTARVGGARDFRGLANLSGAGLRPYEAPSSARFSPLLLWTGVDCHGYWAEAALSAPDAAAGDAQAALAAMIGAARPGLRAGDLARMALGRLPPEAAQCALSYGLGHGIGLAPEEAPFIRPDADEFLAEGMVLALRVAAGVGDRAALASAMVEIGRAGARPLAPFDAQ